MLSGLHTATLVPDELRASMQRGAFKMAGLQHLRTVIDRCKLGTLPVLRQLATLSRQPGF
jgi:hypothetical protein